MIIIEYLTTKQTAEKWKISERQVRSLCKNNKVIGAMQTGKAWIIPANTNKPFDARTKLGKQQTKINKNVLSRITNKKSLLDTMRPLTCGEIARLRKDFVTEFTYNSNAIEGNTLTLRETAMVLEGMTIDKKPLKDHFEVIGHKEAFDFLMDLVLEKQNLSESVIKQIHSLILMDRPNDKGVYRKVPVKIMGAKQIPPQPYLIQPQMEQLMLKYQEIKTSMHLVECVAIFHLLFESVHPFIDGNGRTGRMLINLGLLEAGFPAINVKFTDRQRYYECFNHYYETGSSEKMIELIAEYVEEMLDTYLNILG